MSRRIRPFSRRPARAYSAATTDTATLRALMLIPTAIRASNRIRWRRRIYRRTIFGNILD
jgi:hypothetical protein